MFIWEKLGQIFKVNGNYSWMNSHTTPIATLLMEDKIRVYFSTRSAADENGNFISNSSFFDVSKDDPTNVLYVHDKPLFEMGDYGAFDEFGVMVTDVLEYNGKVYLYYAGWQRLGGGTAAYQVMLGLAISEDEGVTFKKVSKGPIMGIDYYDHISIGNVATIVENGKWKMYYTNLTEWILTGAKPTYKYEIKSALSDNGIFWRKTNDVIISADESGVATPTVHKINGSYHMWFGYRKAYNESNDKIGGYGIGYAFSEDGENWVRDDKKSGISVSKNGWDSEMVCYPDVVQTEGKVYLFYCGNGFGYEGVGVAKLVEPNKD